MQPGRRLITLTAPNILTFPTPQKICKLCSRRATFLVGPQDPRPVADYD
jgi:hypothetical protein